MNEIPADCTNLDATEDWVAIAAALGECTDAQLEQIEWEYERRYKAGRTIVERCSTIATLARLRHTHRRYAAKGVTP